MPPALRCSTEPCSSGAQHRFEEGKPNADPVAVLERSPDQSPAQPPAPLALTDHQLAIIGAAASPLHPRDRRAFLELVASMLDGREISDGMVARAAKEAQRRFWRAPDLSHDRQSKYR